MCTWKPVLGFLCVPRTSKKHTWKSFKKSMRGRNIPWQKLGWLGWLEWLGWLTSHTAYESLGSGWVCEKRPKSRGAVDYVTQPVRASLSVFDAVLRTLRNDTSFVLKRLLVHWPIGKISFRRVSGPKIGKYKLPVTNAVCHTHFALLFFCPATAEIDIFQLSYWPVGVV